MQKNFGLLSLVLAAAQIQYTSGLIYEQYVKANACNSGTTMFICDPTAAASVCIATTKYMDCNIDCANGKDEECRDGLIKCDKCKCVTAEQYKKTCMDVNVACSLANTTACKNASQCVLNNWLMDGTPDCNDKSDEDPCFLKLPSCPTTTTPTTPTTTTTTTPTTTTSTTTTTTTTTPTTTRTTTTTTTTRATTTITTPVPITIGPGVLDSMAHLSSLKAASCDDCKCDATPSPCSNNTMAAMPNLAKCAMYYRGVIFGMFQCKNGIGCVHYKYAMDGFKDCQDGSDENPLYWNECLLERHQCDRRLAKCIDDVVKPYTPDGSCVCECLFGYGSKDNGHTCGPLGQKRRRRFVPLLKDIYELVEGNQTAKMVDI